MKAEVARAKRRALDGCSRVMVSRGGLSRRGRRVLARCVKLGQKGLSHTGELSRERGVVSTDTGGQVDARAGQVGVWHYDERAVIAGARSDADAVAFEDFGVLGMERNGDAGFIAHAREQGRKEVSQALGTQRKLGIEDRPGNSKRGLCQCLRPAAVVGLGLGFKSGQKTLDAAGTLLARLGCGGGEHLLSPLCGIIEELPGLALCLRQDSGRFFAGESGFLGGGAHHARGTEEGVQGWPPFARSHDAAGALRVSVGLRRCRWLVFHAPSTSGL